MAAYPYVPQPLGGAPSGETYAAILVRAGEAGPVGDVLRRLRFTGWIAPVSAGWLPVLAVPGAGTIAAGRRGVVDVGAVLAEELRLPVLVVRVVTDRQLALVGWSEGEEVGRYVSDPSHEPGAEEDVLDDPLGVGDAEAFAAVCGHPELAGEVAEVLDERLDPESVIESERLARLVRLLGLPTWLVATATLPRDIPTGPRARELTRLGFGRTGFVGVVGARLFRAVRRRRPDPVFADPPQGSSGMDPWLM